MIANKSLFVVVTLLLCAILVSVSDAPAATDVFYLQDDSSFTVRDYEDVLDRQPPGLYLSDPKMPPDLDGDGSPGLTIAKIAGNNKAGLRTVQSQEWISEPLYGDLCLSGLSEVHLVTASKDFLPAEAGSLRVEILDQDSQGKTTLIGAATLVADPWSATGNWEEKIFRFTPAVSAHDEATGFPYYLLANGHRLLLRVTIGGDTTNKEIWLTYDSAEYPSRIVFASSTCENIQPPVESDLDWTISGNDLVSGLPGNVGIGIDLPQEKLHVDGNAIVSGTLYSNRIGTSTLEVGDVNAAGTTTTTILAAGTANVSGTTSTEELEVTGESRFAGKVETGLLHVRASGTLAPTNGDAEDGKNHVAFFENTGSGNADGIAIQIHKAKTDQDNNFITFLDDGGKVTGRVEGYDFQLGGATREYFEDLKDFMFGSFSIADLLGFNVGLTWHPDFLDVGSLPSLSINFVTGNFSFNRGSLPSINGSPIGVNPPYEWFHGPSPGTTSRLVANVTPLVEQAYENDYKSLLQMDVASLATFVARMELESHIKDGGVTYGSKGADYAEWLPKLDPEEIILPGYIVGVHGGKVTKQTLGAEQIMAVSEAPVVLGNLPPEGEEANYSKIGFMGQLPVLVWGEVQIGDYILASGLNDGAGLAVAPEKLQLEDLPKVLGRAWSASEGYGYSMINVVIGVKSNEWVEILSRHAQKLEDLKREVTDMKQDIREIKAMLR